ncbi:MAG: hypothetical protein HYY65_12175 [Candidatus Tectomicrobia bacterium]|uniref:Uncharacterized protein n=1 Tax=Tectimicrobiota bacterium TaxID=2528274 RepID=A0A932GRK7_UNCTE|nr:hypothetical protein [Candidatus Tectomicrobia bacterium]
MTDLPAISFLQLRRRFFSDAGEPIPFVLRDKRNTQDDPFDEFLAVDVLANLAAISCARASGPLITPDMVLYRPDRCAGSVLGDLADDPDRIVGIEVKKLERTAQGGVARGAGLDYNTTPPCGRVRVYDVAGRAVDIRGFYLFVCLEKAPAGAQGVVVTALCLVDGNTLNEDFNLYLSITGEREKRIGLGTYGDGADRARPMLIFANPLGAAELDHCATLIHPDANLSQSTPDLLLAYRLHRSVPGDGIRTFYCYRISSDLPQDWRVSDLRDPLPMPTREARTRPRGRFKLPFRL